MVALLCPEVIQSSATDCGPATLKAFLGGHGINVGYGALRRVCQTGVDGTSIDTVEDVATALGLPCEQQLIAARDMVLPEANAFPSIVVFRLACSVAHFVVAWRRVGRWVQVMDPGVGRYWMTIEKFERAVHIHEIEVELSEWSTYSTSPRFRACACARLRKLGVHGAERLFDAAAVADDPWSLAILDASARLAEDVVRRGGLRVGPESSAFVRELWARELRSGRRQIPGAYWSVVPAKQGGGRVAVRGGVVVRPCASDRAGGVNAAELASMASRTAVAVPRELVLAPAEPAPRPLGRIAAVLGDEPVWPFVVAVVALILLGLTPVVEAIVLRGFFEGADLLPRLEHRAAAAACVVGLMAVGLALQLATAGMLRRLGRKLELRFRATFAEKLPRLDDAYFSSRLTADLASRGHMLHRLRGIPRLAAVALRSVVTVVALLAAVAWVHPASMVWALGSLLVTIGVNVATVPLLIERDLRARTHWGALTSFYLDALIGLLPIRSHSAQTAVSREHESLLREWEGAALGVQRYAAWLEGVGAALSLVLVAAAVVTFADTSASPGTILLLLYWLLQVPAQSTALVTTIRSYPELRNTLIRIAEPLDAPETASMGGVDDSRSGESSGDFAAGPVSVCFEDVGVVRNGQTVLERVALEIRPGEHVAVVGESGAGKSTLIGLLLGWVQPDSGQVLVDGRRLSGDRVTALRTRTAWIDAATHLWNDTFFRNLTYGCPERSQDVEAAVAGAELHEVLECLPDGMQTSLGEGGARVSGGEGQRVRIARAMMRRDAGLVLLDEAFRGVDRGTRRRLAQRAREHWAHATLLCVSHDVSQTLCFDRVLVFAGGRLVEDGEPRHLLSRSDSHYARLFALDGKMRTRLAASPHWRRLTLQAGRVLDGGGAA